MGGLINNENIKFFVFMHFIGILFLNIIDKAPRNTGLVSC